MEVKPYSRYSGKVGGVSGFTYTIKMIPDEFTLVANIVNEETERYIIDLINKNKENDVKQLMKCIAAEFQPEIKYKLNVN